MLQRPTGTSSLSVPWDDEDVPGTVSCLHQKHPHPLLLHDMFATSVGVPGACVICACDAQGQEGLVNSWVSLFLLLLWGFPRILFKLMLHFL